MWNCLFAKTTPLSFEILTSPPAPLLNGEGSRNTDFSAPILAPFSTLEATKRSAVEAQPTAGDEVYKK